MRKQLANLVSNRTKVEYLELVDYLKARLNNETFELSLKLSLESKESKTGREWDKGEAYYFLELESLNLIAKRADELKEKVEVYCQTNGK